MDLEAREIGKCVPADVHVAWEVCPFIKGDFDL
jgi:hypothetical protein